MADIEKVIKGLEYCIADEYCDECPYKDDCFEIDNKPYGESLMRDALKLLIALKGREDIIRDQMAIISDMTGQEKESLIREAWRIAIEKLGK